MSDVRHPQMMLERNECYRMSLIDGAEAENISKKRYRTSVKEKTSHEKLAGFLNQKRVSCRTFLPSECFPAKLTSPGFPLVYSRSINIFSCAFRVLERVFTNLQQKVHL